MSKFRFPLGALALSVAVTACVPAPSALLPTGVDVSSSAVPSDVPSATATPTLAPTATPAASPSASPSADPSASVAPTASPVVGPSAPAPDTSRRVIVSGNVYDESGAVVDGALVTVTSLDASVPYEASAATAGGAYVFNNVPEGANVSVTATRDGWTTRTRVGSFQRTDQRNVFDFGAPGSVPKGVGAAHFISKYPEIVSTAPADLATGVDPTNLVYKLTLSEPLGRDARDHFEDALRVLPANDAANGGQAGTTTELVSQEDDTFPFALTVDGAATVAPYAIKDGTTFLGGRTSRATFRWNAAGTEATFSFPAPMVSAENKTAKYQVVLVSAGAGREIEDGNGDQLGTSASGKLNAYPPKGDLILSAFKARDLRVADLDGLTARSRETRWASTHDNQARFDVRRDEIDPKPVSVNVVESGDDTRIELRFSEAMAAFDGTDGGLRHPNLGDDAADLARYTFMLAESTSDLAKRNLEGDGAEDVDPRAVARYGVTDDELEDEFRFDAGAFVTTRTGAAQGSVLIEVDPNDPTLVRLVVIGRRDFLDGNVLKARVEGVGDPAGNAISESQADANQPIARF